MKLPNILKLLFKERPNTRRTGTGERLALDLRVAHLTPEQRALFASLRRLPTKEKD